MNTAMVALVTYSTNDSVKIGVKGFSEKAIQLEIDNRYIWLPLSQIYVIQTAMGLYACMPQWLAKNNALQYRLSTDEEINSNVWSGKAEYVTLDPKNIQRVV